MTTKPVGNDILRVKYGWHGSSLVAVTEKHLSGSILLCWFVAAKPSKCKYSLSMFAVYLCGE